MNKTGILLLMSKMKATLQILRAEVGIENEGILSACSFLRRGTYSVSQLRCMYTSGKVEDV